MYKYITGDLRNMSEEERIKVKVRHGRVDLTLLYTEMFGCAPTQKQKAKLKAALDATMSDLTRCQRELLTMEFGTMETTLGKMVGVTDVLEDPVDANEKKLTQAVNIIRERMPR